MYPMLRVNNQRVVPLEFLASHPGLRRGEGLTVPGTGLIVPGTQGKGFLSSLTNAANIRQGAQALANFLPASIKGTGLIVPGSGIFSSIANVAKKIVQSPIFKKGLKAGVKTLRSVATPAIKKVIESNPKLAPFSGLADKGLSMLNSAAESKGYGANPDGSFGHGPSKMFIKMGRPMPGTSKPMTPRQIQQLQKGEGFLGDLASTAISSLGGLLIDKLSSGKKRGRGVAGSGSATKGIALKPSQYGKDS